MSPPNTQPKKSNSLQDISLLSSPHRSRNSSYHQSSRASSPRAPSPRPNSSVFSTQAPLGPHQRHECHASQGNFQQAANISEPTQPLQEPDQEAAFIQTTTDLLVEGDSCQDIMEQVDFFSEKEIQEIAVCGHRINIPICEYELFKINRPLLKGPAADIVKKSPNMQQAIEKLGVHERVPLVKLVKELLFFLKEEAIENKKDLINLIHERKLDKVINDSRNFTKEDKQRLWVLAETLREIWALTLKESEAPIKNPPSNFEPPNQSHTFKTPPNRPSFFTRVIEKIQGFFAEIRKAFSYILWLIGV